MGCCGFFVVVVGFFFFSVCIVMDIYQVVEERVYCNFKLMS